MLKRKNKEIEQEVNKSLQKSAFLMQNEVKLSIAGEKAEPTSVDTGRFLNSVDISLSKDQAIVFSDVEYAKHLEYGTSRIRPRKHFRNSLARNKAQIIELMKNDIKNI